MKRFFMMATALMLLTLFAAQAQAELVVDDFENWKNPFVAEGWTSAIHGVVTGGEFNQIYGAGQGISCGGRGTNFKSVYRDIPVMPGTKYIADVYIEANTTNANGVLDFSNVRLWMQFDQADGTILATYGKTYAESRLYKEIAVEGIAPPGTHHVRVILQVMGGKSGGAVFHYFNLYKDYLPGKAFPSVVIYGPDFIRNTEWLGKSKVQQLWTAYAEGGGPGDYDVVPLHGSEQGISCAGPPGTYREIWRFFDITPGVTSHRARIQAESSTMNQLGVRDSSRLEMHMLYYDSSSHLLPGGGMSSGDSGEQPFVYLAMQVPNPPGAVRLQIIVRVLAGTGGGAAFDHFYLESF